MNAKDASDRLRERIRMKHLSLATEEAYCGWITRYARFLKEPRRSWSSSEEKVESFLTTLAKRGVAASTQNQAFNAILFFYRDVLQMSLGNVDAMRARQPQTIRDVPTIEQVKQLLFQVRDVHGYPTRMIVRLIYGCGMRVTEPCNLRIKDVDLNRQSLVIRRSKGQKDRFVPIPCSLFRDVRDQLNVAKVAWMRDQKNQVPVALPCLLSKKYPAAKFSWRWAWLFPAHRPCRDPRTGEIVRWRVHETNIQKCVREAGRCLGIELRPHDLRHAYATHSLSRGVNVRSIQQAMGHSSLETTMTYLHNDGMQVPSPLDA